MLGEQADEGGDEWHKVLLRHHGYRLIVMRPLEHQRVRAGLDRVGFQVAVQADLLPRRPQQRQQHDRQGPQQQQPVTPLRRVDARLRQAHPKTQVLDVPERLLDAEALRAQLGPLGPLPPGVADRQAPGVLHPLGLDAYDRRHRLLIGRHRGTDQQARPAVRWHPLRSCPRLADHVGHLDALPEPDDEVEVQLVEQRIQLAVAEAAVREHRDSDMLRDELAQSDEQLVLMSVTPALQLGLADRLPQQRGGAPVRGHHVQRQRRLLVGSVRSARM